jgi:hypothetical protein
MRSPHATTHRVNRLIPLAIAIGVASAALAVAERAPTASASQLKDCANEFPGASSNWDSYGVRFEEAVTLNRALTCAKMKSTDGKIKVPPVSSKTWKTTAPVGYYRQETDKWRQSSAISWSIAEKFDDCITEPMFTVTGNNSALESRHFAVNVLWTAPSPECKKKSSKVDFVGKIGSEFFRINADKGSVGFLDPKWTFDELKASSGAADRIYADAAYRHHGFRIEDSGKIDFCRKDVDGNPIDKQDSPGVPDCDFWSINLGTFCSLYFNGQFTAALNQPGDNVPEDCRIAVCDSPKKSTDAPVKFCELTATVSASSSTGDVATDDAGSIAPDENGIVLIEAHGSLAEPPSLRCPESTAPIFVEAVLLAEPGDDVAELDGVPDPLPVIHPGGASIVTVPEFGAVRSALQVTCRSLGEELLRVGDQILGTERADRVSDDRLGTHAFLGFGDDIMSSTGASAVILAGPGRDLVAASGASSVVRGGPGDDRLVASGADILLIGGIGRDVLIGAPNAVTLINALDGQPGDVVLCRSPKNRVFVDYGDTVIGACANVDRKSPEPQWAVPGTARGYGMVDIPLGAHGKMIESSQWPGAARKSREAHSSSID